MADFFSITHADPEIQKALQEREMKMEFQINKFRAGFMIIIAILDSISMFILDKSSLMKNPEKFQMFELLFALFSVSSIIFIYFLSKKGTYKSWLKFYTVTFDLLFTFLFGYVFLKVFDLPLPVSPLSFVLILTIIFLFFNMLSVLRSTKSIVIYSGILSFILNTVIFQFAEAPSLMPYFYTSAFIIGFTLFNLWVSKHIIDFLIVNKKLNIAYSDLETANGEIMQRNEEITAQRDEIFEQKQKIEKYSQNITASIKYAQRIQQAALPEISEINKVFDEYFIFFKPRDIVSGDFYWIKKVDGKIIFTAADCTGHGVPGAFMSMLGISILNEITAERKDLSAAGILNLLRERIKEYLKQTGKEDEAKDGMDIALCILEPRTRELQFAGANNPLYIVNKNGLSEIKPDRQPIGIYLKEHDFKNNIVEVKEGDKLYLFSDGFADQFGGTEGKKYMSKRFKKLLVTIYNESVSKQKSLLEEELINWKGEYSQVDDILILGVEV